jgi:predicted NBD/HSP70 family sugar kinase
VSSSAPSPQESFIHGKLINLVRTGQAVTRPALEQETGLGRKVVTQRVQQAIDVGLLEDGDLAPSAGGRPSRLLRFRTEAGHVYAGMIGATEMTAAVATLDGTLVASLHEDWVAADRPDQTLEVLDALFVRLARRTRTEPWAFGIGVAGPVDFGTGRLVDPPIMPGWDGYSVSARLRERYGAPVLVDNDVNIMALGEYWARWRDTAHLLFVKVGTGIGCGVITDGRIHRGAQGAAGDIGHIHVPDHDDVICRCGNLGCLEAIAGGGAMAARLSEAGINADNSRDVVRHVRDGRPEAMRLVRQAGRELGGVLASAVNFFNPGVIVIGGDIAHADEHLLAGVREVVYRRSTALATRSIRIARSTLDDRAGVIGAAVMVTEAVLAPDAVDQTIAATA